MAIDKLRGSGGSFPPGPLKLGILPSLEIGKNFVLIHIKKLYFLGRMRKLDVNALHEEGLSQLHYLSQVTFLVVLWHLLPFQC